MADLKPGRGSDQFPLRLPEGMRDRIKDQADKHGRSMNAEIIDRLERFDALAREAEALSGIASSLAFAIDKVVTGSAPDAGLLSVRLRSMFGEGEQHDEVDLEKFVSSFTEDVYRLLFWTVHIPKDLGERIKQKALKNKRSIADEALSVLDREYPAPSDVMHIHLEDIRHALDLYERETDPQARLRLQYMVEGLVTLGHAIEVDWSEEDE